MVDFAPLDPHAQNATPKPSFRFSGHLPPALDELRRRKQWVTWGYVWENKKWTKPPRHARKGYRCNGYDPANCGTFDEALKTARRLSLAGIGYSLSAEDNLTGIDLDHCYDPATKTFTPRAAKVLSFRETYAEFSPGGDGLRLFAKGKIDKAIKEDDAGIEVYGRNRFLTVTGFHLPETPCAIQEAPQTIAYLAKEAEKARSAKQAAKEQATQTQAGHSFFRQVNDTALQRLDAWVPSLFPSARKQATDAWRVRSSELGRDFEEDLSIHPDGIQDFGPETPRTAIDLIMEYGPARTVKDAALWLCDMMHVDPISLGWQEPAKAEQKWKDDSTVEWELPLPLPALLPDVPKMLDDMLPNGVRPWLTDIADRVQCSLEFPAVSAVVALATVIGRRVGIYPKRHDDWLVIANLWALIIGRPGVLKTPAMVEAMKPLDRLVAQALRDYAEAIEKYTVDAAIHEAKVKAVKSEMGKAARKNDDELMGELDGRLAKLIKSSPERPVALRYKTNDATVEKLQDLLASNPHGLLLYRDELAGWLYSLEKPGREGDREFYLEAWNGDGSFTLDRIGRGTVHSPALCLSLLGSIQPGKLAEYVGGAIGGGISDDGLLQRLQLAVWPDPEGKWINIDRWPDTPAKTRAFQIFERLASLKREHIPKSEHSQFEDPDKPPAIRFSAEAQDIFDAWRADLETRLRSGTLHPAMESHLSKYRSLMPALALVFHLTKHTHQVGIKDFTPGCIDPVSEYAATLAIRWCDFLEQHARRVYAADVDKDKHQAHALARHILRGDVSDNEPVRNIYRHHWTMLKNHEDVYAALFVLERLHWVSVHTEQTGGRSRDVIRINPAVTNENFSPFTQVTGAKSAKSPTADPGTDPSGTSGTCHLGNGADFFHSPRGGEEEEENSEKALLVPTDKSAKSPHVAGNEFPDYYDTLDPSFDAPLEEM